MTIQSTKPTRAISQTEKGKIFYIVLAIILLGSFAVGYFIFEARKPSPSHSMASQHDPKKADKPAIGTQWSLRCEEQDNSKCEAFQGIFIAQGDQHRRLAEVALSIIPATKKTPKTARIGLNLPSDLNAKHGVILRIDEGRNMKMPIDSCNKNGCIGISTLPLEVISIMKKGKVFNIYAMDLKQNKIRIKTSLEGFSTAIEHLE